MNYKILYHPNCLKRLKRIPSSDREKAILKLKSLSKNPFSRTFDIKKLANTKKSYRLRIGDLRTIYELDQKLKTIYVWEIDYRGKVY